MIQRNSGGITNVTIVTETGTVENGTLLWRDGTIRYVGSYDRQAVTEFSSDAKLIDGEGGWLLPGFIDLHVHGGFGSDFMDANAEAYDRITRFHGRNGTTAMLATTVTAPKEALESVLQATADYRRSGMAYAELLGVHLEGPFISPLWPGAQNPEFIVPPQIGWLEEWTERYPGLIRLLTLAPERPGALELISWLTSRHILAACGHTDAKFEDIQRALSHGLCHAVHTFNAMRGLHHREPGTVGAVFLEPGISAEVIADGLHVHPACIRLLVNLKPEDKLILITDAMSAAGLGDGDYSLGGLKVVVKDGAARLKEGDSLAGSTLTMIDAFRYVVREVGLAVPHASKLASDNPAKRLGRYDDLGSIRTGKRADMLLISKDLELQQVRRQGKPIDMGR